MLRDPTPTDVEQLSHVAADADGAPLTEAELAFLASEQNVLRVDEWGDLVVVSWTRNLYYKPPEVRAAIAAAVPIWERVRWVAMPFVGRLPDPAPAAEDAQLLELQLEMPNDCP